MIYSRKHLRSGFTFVELVIAITILGILGLIMGPPLVRYVTQARDRAAESQVSTLKLSINSYYGDLGKYPSALVDLVRKPAEASKKWQGPYLDQTEIPLDPWDNEFVYVVNPKGTQPPYQLYSYGAGGPGSPAEEWISAWK